MSTFSGGCAAAQGPLGDRYAESNYFPCFCGCCRFAPHFARDSRDARDELFVVRVISHSPVVMNVVFESHSNVAAGSDAHHVRRQLVPAEAATRPRCSGWKHRYHVSQPYEVERSRPQRAEYDVEVKVRSEKVSARQERCEMHEPSFEDFQLRNCTRCVDPLRELLDHVGRVHARLSREVHRSYRKAGHVGPRRARGCAKVDVYDMPPAKGYADDEIVARIANALDKIAVHRLIEGRSLIRIPGVKVDDRCARVADADSCLGDLGDCHRECWHLTLRQDATGDRGVDYQLVAMAHRSLRLR